MCREYSHTFTSFAFSFLHRNPFFFQSLRLRQRRGARHSSGSLLRLTLLFPLRRRCGVQHSLRRCCFGVSSCLFYSS